MERCTNRDQKTKMHQKFQKRNKKLYLPKILRLFHNHSLDMEQGTQPVMINFTSWASLSPYPINEEILITSQKKPIKLLKIITMFFVFISIDYYYFIIIIIISNVNMHIFYFIHSEAV